jgi:phage repressor protein C with HTH and peptisase S24 domain
MLRHDDIWRAIDRLASAKGLSVSGLAKLAGLDPTTFNRSKRATGDGKLRWPSTESLSKILSATGASLNEFVALIAPSQVQTRNTTQRIPVIGYAQAGDPGYFDEAGCPIGHGWDQLLFPDVGDCQAYALEISGDSMEPVYRDGDHIVISPSANIRRGDRVVVRSVAGEVLIKQLTRETATRMELKSINPAHPDRVFLKGDVAWMARIIWASQ